MQEILSTEARQLIRDNPLFDNLTDDQMNELLDMMYEERVSVGVNIVQEGEPGDTLYVVRAGRAEVLKQDDNGDFHHIAMLKPGDVIGEISLIDDRPRSATVRAVENTQLVALAVADLKAKSKPEVSLENILKVNFAKIMSQNIRRLNSRTVNRLKDQLKFTQKQIQMGQYIFKIMTLVVFYVLALGIFQSAAHIGPATAYLALPVVYLFGGAFYGLVRKSDFDLKTFGLTWDGAEAAVMDSLMFTLLLMLPLIILYKMFIVEVDPTAQHATIFLYQGVLSTLSAKEKILLMIAFALYVPVYEFIVRGVSQTSFMMFLTHRNRRWQAILLAALFFSVASLDLSIKFGIAIFALNLFWGWLYSRQSSLIGVILSHLIIGYFGLFVVGFNF